MHLTTKTTSQNKNRDKKLTRVVDFRLLIKCWISCCEREREREREILYIINPLFNQQSPQKGQKPINKSYFITFPHYSYYVNEKNL